jgi:hypothetical protein
MKFLDKSERQKVSPKSEEEIAALKKQIQMLEIQLALARSELERSFNPLNMKK